MRRGGTALDARITARPLPRRRATVAAGSANTIPPGPYDIRALQRTRLGIAAMTMLVIAVAFAGRFRPASLRRLRTVATGRTLCRRSAIGMASRSAGRTTCILCRSTSTATCMTITARFVPPLARPATGSVTRAVERTATMCIPIACITGREITCWAILCSGILRLSAADMRVRAGRLDVGAVNRTITMQSATPLRRT